MVVNHAIASNALVAGALPSDAISKGRRHRTSNREMRERRKGQVVRERKLSNVPRERRPPSVKGSGEAPQKLRSTDDDAIFLRRRDDGAPKNGRARVLNAIRRRKEKRGTRADDGRKRETDESVSKRAHSQRDNLLFTE